MLTQKIGAIAAPASIYNRTIYNGWIAELSVALKLSFQFGFQELVNAGLGKLDDNWLYTLTDADDLVSITSVIASNEQNMPASTTERIFREAIEWVTEDTCGWDNLSFAHDVLNEMASNGVAGAQSNLEHVSEQLDERAEKTIGELYEADKLWEADAPELEAMVFHLTSQSGRNETPGLDEAKTVVMEHLRERREAEAEARRNGSGYEPPDYEGDDKADASDYNRDSEIADIMSLLRRDGRE